MAESGIPSARQKLARAEKHMRALDRAVRKFRRETPYEFAPRSTPNEPGKPDFYLRAVVTQAPPIPQGWALITGDILTNARAALDHAVFPHVRARRSQVDIQDIQYPIVDSKAQFANKARRFSRDVCKVVRASQPYHQPSPAEHPFAALRDLVNIDKHRNLVIAEYAVDSFKLAPDTRYEIVDISHSNVPLEVGATACEAHCRLTKRVRGRIDFAAQVEYAETIVIPATGRSWNLLGTLKLILKQIGPLLDRLEEAAGC